MIATFYSEVGPVDGWMPDVGETYAYNGPALKERPLPVPPPPPGTSTGPHSTPREWWEAQADFYGRPVPPFQGL